MNDDRLFSVNRLVEFGLEVAVAQRMVGAMNQALQAAHTPGVSVPNAATAPAATPTFFVALDGKQAGPFSESELSRLIMERRINSSTLVWRPGMPAWRPASDIPEVWRLVMLCPPDLPKTE